MSHDSGAPKVVMKNGVLVVSYGFKKKTKEEKKKNRKKFLEKLWRKKC